MKKLLVAVAIIVLLAARAKPAQSPVPSKHTARETVEALWQAASRGELLTPDGWKRASDFFTESDPSPNYKVILVMSDYFGVNQVSVTDTTAEVQMEMIELGQIDSALRYSPPQIRRSDKTSLSYRLVSGPSSVVTYVPDGAKLKKLQQKQIPGTLIWRIRGTPGLWGHPWVTVNAAIRYVLEQREKTTDPAIKGNADATIAKLLTLH